MNNFGGKVNILLIVGICVIVVIVGFFAYQTFLKYQEILKEASPEETSQEATPTESEAEEKEEAEGEAPQIFVTPALEEKNIVMIVSTLRDCVSL